MAGMVRRGGARHGKPRCGMDGQAISQGKERKKQMTERIIYKAIAGVMKDVGAVGKDSKNPQQGYKYRGIDAVMNALQPAMVKHGIFAAPTVISSEREERQTRNGGLLIYTMLTVKYSFFAEDGSYVETTVVGEGMDSSDKSSNKAMSAAFKYACFQTFCIPTEEMQDADAESPQVKPKDDRTGEPAYPSREVMLGHVKKLYQVEKLLTAYRIDSIDKLTDAQVQALYNKATERLKQQKETK